MVGVADLVDDLPPLDAVALRMNRCRHCIPEIMDSGVLAARWIRPWVLEGARPLGRPVLAGQRKGQVTWVTLSGAATHAVLMA